VTSDFNKAGIVEAKAKAAEPRQTPYTRKAKACKAKATSAAEG